jgi:hypothetical protein
MEYQNWVIEAEDVQGKRDIQPDSEKLRIWDERNNTLNFELNRTVKIPRYQATNPDFPTPSVPCTSGSRSPDK